MSATASEPAALLSGPPLRTLFWFSLPTLGSMVLRSLHSSVNAIWISQLIGEEALVASVSANLVLLLLVSTIFGLGMSITILIGQAAGARDLRNVRQVLGTGMVLFGLISGITLAIGYAFSPRIVDWMHTPAVARELAIDYMRVIFLAMPFVNLLVLLMTALRGLGDASTPLKFTALTIVADFVLNPLLIAGFGPIPALGIAGSAWATLFSHLIALLGLLIWLRRRRHLLWIPPREWHSLRPDLRTALLALRKGLPMGLEMIVLSLSAILLLSLVNEHGAATAAAYGVVMQVWTYLMMPSVAIGASVSAIVSQAIGAGLRERIAPAATAGTVLHFGLTGLSVLLLAFADHWLFRLFLPGGEHTLAIARHIDLIGAWSFVLLGISLVLFGAVRGAGVVLPSLGVLVLSMFIARLGFAWAMEPTLGADAIWWSFPVGAAVSALLSTVYYRYGGWRQARSLLPHDRPLNEVDHGSISF